MRARANGRLDVSRGRQSLVNAPRRARTRRTCRAAAGSLPRHPSGTRRTRRAPRQTSRPRSGAGGEAPRRGARAAGGAQRGAAGAARHGRGVGGAGGALGAGRGGAARRCGADRGAAWRAERRLARGPSGGRGGRRGALRGGAKPRRFRPGQGTVSGPVGGPPRGRAHRRQPAPHLPHNQAGARRVKCAHPKHGQARQAKRI